MIISRLFFKNKNFEKETKISLPSMFPGNFDIFGSQKYFLKNGAKQAGKRVSIELARTYQVLSTRFGLNWEGFWIGPALEKSQSKGFELAYRAFSNPQNPWIQNILYIYIYIYFSKHVVYIHI